jgi:glycine cleavage system H lipoate-binding protein
MTILFVLLTFLVVLLLTYRTRSGQPVIQAAAAVEPPAQPAVPNVELAPATPKGYYFHPGHTWAVDAGHQSVRVGMDSFAARLVGRIDHLQTMGTNKWVRQGQKLWTVTCGDLAVDMVSPIEGIVVAVNPELQKTPSLPATDPFQNGWICLIKSPDMEISLKNLMPASFVGPWTQNNMRRLAALTPEDAPATAQDGGLPVPGLLARVDETTRHALIREFFLT